MGTETSRELEHHLSREGTKPGVPHAAWILPRAVSYLGGSWQGTAAAFTHLVPMDGLGMDHSTIPCSPPLCSSWDTGATSGVPPGTHLTRRR